MLKVEYTSQFKRDLKLSKKRRKDLNALQKIMTAIENEEPLLHKYRDHPLTGDWKHHRELHIEPDWLLIYKIMNQKNVVVFVRTGTHSDLF